jgi:hypothetical protein
VSSRSGKLAFVCLLNLYSSLPPLVYHLFLSWAPTSAGQRDTQCKQRQIHNGSSTLHVEAPRTRAGIAENHVSDTFVLILRNRSPAQQVTGHSNSRTTRHDLMHAAFHEMYAAPSNRYRWIRPVHGDKYRA